MLSAEYSNMSWDNHIAQQRRVGTYATEVFIKATAVYMGIDILITSENCTEQNPYTKVIKSWNNEILDVSPSIVIENISGIHFQSFLPL